MQTLPSQKAVTFFLSFSSPVDSAGSVCFWRATKVYKTIDLFELLCTKSTVETGTLRRDQPLATISHPVHLGGNLKVV